MRHLTNMFDPKHPNAKECIACEAGQSPDQAWEAQREYLLGKTIGEPKATDFHTVEQLKAMHMVGIYAQEN